MHVVRGRNRIPSQAYLNLYLKFMMSLLTTLLSNSFSHSVLSNSDWTVVVRNCYSVKLEWTLWLEVKSMQKVHQEVYGKWRLEKIFWWHKVATHAQVSHNPYFWKNPDMHEIFLNSIFHELFQVPSYATMNVDEEYDFNGAVRRTLSILEPSRTRSALWSQFSDWSSFRQGSFTL